MAVGKRVGVVVVSRDDVIVGAIVEVAVIDVVMDGFTELVGVGVA